MDTTGRIVALAGATGNLGRRIAGVARARGVAVRAITRADFAGDETLRRACEGASVVVSSLSGVRDTIVDSQTRLLAAAVDAGVPRFVPSDYCIDYHDVPPGANRNLDLRREFQARVDAAPVAATSVLCGMFADLLIGPAPVVLFGARRVLYWGDPDQPLDFTAIDDVAAVTAAAALDDAAPRWLRIAGDVQSARGLAAAAETATGERFRLLRAGGLRRLRLLIRVARAVAPGRDTPFPPWQGMQYLHDMFDGRAKLEPLDNDRYPDIRWTPVHEVLSWKG